MPNVEEELAGRLEVMPEKTGRAARIAATAFVLFALGFWIYAFSPWARERFVAVDGLSDFALRDRIELRCAAALDSIDELPSARSANSPTERADNLDDVNAALTAMVNDIRGFDGGTVDDQRLIGLWMDDWTIYMTDRDVHVDRLREGEDVRFLNTEADGVFIAERMNGFARRNELDSCETPGDL